jgi:hypothetical protein
MLLSSTQPLSELASSLLLLFSSPLCDTMPPKSDKLPATKVFGRSRVSERLVKVYEKMGFIEAGRGCAPDKETVPSPRAKEVIVYRDLFSAGLRFPLDAVVVRIHRNFDMYLHHLTPNAVLQLSVYMWASKTMGVSPSVENFVQAHTIHHQPLHMERMQGSTVVKEEAQFASLNFKYHSNVEAPVVCYKNKWDKYWNAY